MKLLAHTPDVAHCSQIQHLALEIKPVVRGVAARAGAFSFARAGAIFLDDHRVLAPYVDVCSRAS